MVIEEAANVPFKCCQLDTDASASIDRYLYKRGVENIVLVNVCIMYTVRSFYIKACRQHESSVCVRTSHTAIYKN